MDNKVRTLTDLTAYVQPGQTLALGGLMLYRRPVAFVRELLRAQPDLHDLTLLNFTASYESDLLVGAQMVSTVRTCYFGLEVFGLAPMFTASAQAGTLKIMEETEASLVFGIRASLATVGFMAGRGWLGTDLPRLRPDVKTITDPYNGETLMAFPAIPCDVAVIHALAADTTGNAIIGRNMGIDLELATLATHTLITTETLVDRLEEADIPGVAVSAVALAPHGAWPTSCHPNYALNGGEIMAYIDACSGLEGFRAYVDAPRKTPAPT